MKALMITIDKSCHNVITYNIADNLEALVLKLMHKLYDVYAYKKISGRCIRIFTSDGRVLNVSYKHIALWDINKLY